MQGQNTTNSTATQTAPGQGSLVARQLSQNSQKFLQEMDAKAQQLMQQSQSPQVKEAAQKIHEYCQLIQANEQVEQQLR